MKSELVILPTANGFGLAQAVWDPGVTINAIVSATINGPDDLSNAGNLSGATAMASVRDDKILVVVTNVKNSAPCAVWVTVA